MRSSCRPQSKCRTMLGWFSFSAIATSRTKRRCSSGSRAVCRLQELDDGRRRRSRDGGHDTLRPRFPWPEAAPIHTRRRCAVPQRESLRLCPPSRIVSRCAAGVECFGRAPCEHVCSCRRHAVATTRMHTDRGRVGKSAALVRFVLEPLAVLFEAELGEKARHRVGMHAQQPRRPAFVALRGPQRLLHRHASQARQVHERQCRIAEPRVARPIGQLRLAIQNVRLLDDVGQLADIARPMILAELAQGFAVRLPQRR